jgi:hypothetical protein
MANSTAQLAAESWVRDVWLPKKYGQPFWEKRLRLIEGDKFEFDAVSDDNSIIVNISTSSAITAGQKYPAGKVQKLRADILFMMMATGKRKLLVLTEQDMFELCQKEKRNGRIPAEIDFVYAELPTAITTLLIKAKTMASKEVSPKR